MTTPAGSTCRRFIGTAAPTTTRIRLGAEAAHAGRRRRAPAELWQGHMDGAARSGERAARDVVAALRG